MVTGIWDFFVQKNVRFGPWRAAYASGATFQQPGDGT